MAVHSLEGCGYNRHREGRRDMSTPKAPEVTERESRKDAEASRQAEWEKPSFMRELFLGTFRLDLVHPFPLPGEWRPGFHALLEAGRAVPPYVAETADN